MWLCLRQGFFSLVRNSRGPGKVLRARNAKHMTRIKHAFSGFHACTIIHTLDSDYPYRIVITNRQAEQFMLWTVDQIDYTNFKDAVADVASEAHCPYLGFLHEVWHVSREWLQPPPPRAIAAPKRTSAKIKKTKD
jgi:hypothetical protein